MSTTDDGTLVSTGEASVLVTEELLAFTLILTVRGCKSHGFGYSYRPVTVG